MSTDELLQKINARLQRYNRDELQDLIWDYLNDCDVDDLAYFLDLMRQKSRPAAVAAPTLVDGNTLLRRIQELYQAIANDEYVQYGAGYDPDYGEYRGFGDDGWIDDMDGLFAEASSLYRAGNYGAAAAAFIALFDIFGLSEDGFHFTRPDPTTALQTDLAIMVRMLFTSLGMLNPSPDVCVPAPPNYAEDQEREEQTILELSSELRFYSASPYALLDAWEDRPEWMQGLVAQLLELCQEPAQQEQSSVFLHHHAELLRELARRSYTMPQREELCRSIGVQQGWPYLDLVTAYSELSEWSQLLVWADDGLAKLPPQSIYRATLEEARGIALLRLDRPAEALLVLRALFMRKQELPIYLSMRAAAQASGDWPQLYPELTATLEQPLIEFPGSVSSYSSASLMTAAMLGFAHLLEGQIDRAVAWASRADIPAGWSDNDLLQTVASGLLRMGLAAASTKPDDKLQAALAHMTPMIREQGLLLEQVAQHLDAQKLFDGAVQLYERIVTRAVDGRKRESYALAASYANSIRSIRKLQERTADFDRYYKELLASYPRLPAFQDEMRKAIEGQNYKRKR